MKKLLTFALLLLALSAQAVVVTKNNYTATTAPTATDDTPDYTEGSIWVDVNNNRTYVCVDNTSTAAIWIEIGGFTGYSILDEDNMSSDSDTAVATQQSVKAYVDGAAPTAHAASHTDGTDDIQDATSVQKGLMTSAYAGKLDSIESNADVTDAANVDAAGAVMNADTTTASMSFVIDEDNMASNSATKVPTQQSVKAYVDNNAGSGDVAGPAGATDNAIARFNSTTGKLIQNSVVTIDDTGNISTFSLTLDGSANRSIDVTDNGVDGVNLTIRAGDTSGSSGGEDGGDLILEAGDGYDATGGSVFIRSGEASMFGNAGNITLQAHDDASAGATAGSIILNAGDSGGGTDGVINLITVGTAGWDVTAEGHFVPSAANTYDLGASGTEVRDLYIEGNINGVSAGSITGRSTLWKTIWLDAGAAIPPASGGAALVAADEQTTNGNINDFYAFDDASTEEVQFSFVIPDIVDSSETMKCKIYWVSPATGNVVWGVSSVEVADTEDADVAFGAESQAADAGNGANDLNISAAFTVDTSPEPGSVIYIKVTRDGADGSDTMTGDAQLKGIYIQYRESATAPSAW